jgi:hypothetical protein
MNVRMTQRDRKVLATGAIACAALAAGARGIPALLQWTRDSRGAAAQLVGEEARARASIARADETRDTLTSRNARYLALAPRLLEGESAAGAGAALASILSGAAAVSSVRVGSVQIRADTATHGVFTKVAVSVDLTGDIRGLTAMLATLERGPALLAVRELSITQPEPAAGDDRAETLRADLMVEGLMLTPRRANGGSR